MVQQAIIKNYYKEYFPKKSLQILTKVPGVVWVAGVVGVAGGVCCLLHHNHPLVKRELPNKRGKKHYYHLLSDNTLCLHTMRRHQFGDSF